MHSYQNDVDKRNKPLWVMIIVATVITAMLSGWLSSIDVNPTIKNFAHAPSAYFIFMILYVAFDNWLWQWPPLKWVFGISEPNLAGIWRGRLKSNTHDKEIDITLKIKQRWSKISVAIILDKSTSCSISVNILCSKALPVLIYNYDNIPYDRDSETMTRHIGTAELVLKDDNTLIGNYFTSGERKTEGAISVSRALLGDKVNCKNTTCMT